MTHFRLKSPKLNGEVYINGAWTNNRFLPQYKMNFDEMEQIYKASILLKQGYYSYQYLLVDSDGKARNVPSEGNFFQTENQYQALVYYRGIGSRTDRLVGFAQIRR